MTHTFSDTAIDFNIIYKRRKTIGISIDYYGNIEVQAPKETPLSLILPALEKKWTWIQQVTKEMKDRIDGNHHKVYEHGEKFLYLGSSYPIVITIDLNTPQDNVIFEEDKLHIFVKEDSDELIKQALKRFYYQKCKALVERRIRAYQSEFKTKPRTVRISDNNSTWGTCSSKMELTFNWKLAMAPMEVIDYVVVHEMCHMVHLNHERSFWRLVGKMIPDYEQRKNWLALSSYKMIL